jgi:hypothetical protein
MSTEQKTAVKIAKPWVTEAQADWATFLLRTSDIEEFLPDELRVAIATVTNALDIAASMV